MAITDLGLIGSGSSKTAATTLSFANTTGAVIQAGTLIVIVGCWDNIASVTAPTITCSTVGGATAIAGHATAVGSGVTTTAGAGIWHQCFRALTTASIANGGTIATLTSNQSAVARAAHAEGWTGVDTTLRGTVATGTSITGSPSVATAGTALVAGDLVIGSVSFENNAQMTGDADTLNGTWDAIVGTFTTGSGVATNVGTGSQDKTVTATGVQTFNPTGGVADTVACVYALVPLPEPTFTQASYAFYNDSGSPDTDPALVQDTAYPVDLAPNFPFDRDLLLRTRIQSTNLGAALGSDDYQLQWEKNASGIWTNVAPVDGPPLAAFEPAQTTSLVPATTGFGIIGESFLGDGRKLSKAAFFLSVTGIPPGYINAFLYAHTGTFGSTGTATGSPLATSAPFPANGIGNTTWYTFTFDGTFTLVNGTAYCIVLAPDSLTSGSPGMALYASTNAPLHPGNQVRRNASTLVWDAVTSPDALFRVSAVGTPTTGVVGYDLQSTGLAKGAATITRLGAGVGSFSAGKFSPDGLVSDLGWPSNNYTELLYSLRLKQDLANGDTLRFRVLRNGSATGMTYTQVPTLSIANIPAAVTQAAYRFYADGTESDSVALAAQDSSYTASLAAGDVNLQLRTRMQSTSTTVVPGGSTWQLQYERNASGVWTSVVSGSTRVLADTNPVSNRSTTNPLFSGTTRHAQSFLGNGAPLARVGFDLLKVGVPNGTVTAVLYASSSTFGDAAGVPTGAALASSTTVLATTAIGAGWSGAWAYFDFDGTFTPANGTPYFIAIVSTNSLALGDHLSVGLGTGSHAGHQATYSGTWVAASADLVFELYTVGGAVIPFDSANLTDGASTTARLTAGTGNLELGGPNVSETGLATTQSLTGNYYMELLYSLTLKQARLTDGDTLRFRVLRSYSGVDTTTTYAQVPTIPITFTALAVQPPRNIHLPNPAIPASFIR